MAQPLAPVIVVGGHKGGVGRTSVAVNLAAMLALSGRRTLLVDLDPKGDATASVGLPRATVGKSVEQLSDPWGLLRDTSSVDCSPGLDVWPGGRAIEALRAELTKDESPPTDLLDAGLELARQRYRAIVIDAPPDLGPLGCNALAAGDVLLLPLANTSFAERALEETIATAFNLRGSIDVVGVRLMVRDTAIEQPDDDSDEPLRGPLGVELLDCVITFDGDTLLKATSAGLPVFEYDPASKAARCFVELAREIQAKVMDPARLTPSPHSSRTDLRPSSLPPPPG